MGAGGVGRSPPARSPPGGLTMTNEPQQPQPIYLKGPGPPVFALLHACAEPRRGTSVLLCPPFGWDDMCSYRIRREWAEQLAEAGYTTLRIDFPGSGDSAGSPTEPGQLNAWTEAVSLSAGWLRRRSGGQQKLAVIGIGMGGVASLWAALQGAPIDELVLWAVPAQGRRLLRELRAFAALALANASAGPSTAPAGEGSLVVNGYLLSAATVRELELLDFAQLEGASPRLTRALVLGRDGMT